MPLVGVTRTATFGMLVAAMWSASRPYRGLDHDARLYAAQALHAIDPAAYANDLFFRFGSQDLFTPFTPLYASLISKLDLWPASVLILALGHCAWVAAVVLLLRTVVADSGLVILSLVFVLALPNDYGGLSIFKYGEPFATPRLLAESLTIAALALMIRSRWTFAVPLLAIAGLVHPLMAAPAIVVFMSYAGMTNKRLLWLAVVALIVVAACTLLRIEPFDRAWKTFDPEWLRIVKVRSGIGFITQWRIYDFARLASTIFLGVLAFRSGNAVQKTLLAVTVTTGLGGVAATLVGADIAHNVLVTNVQPWRALWLATLTTNALVAVFVVHRWDTAPETRPLSTLPLLAGVASLLFTYVNPAFFVTAALLLGLAVIDSLWTPTHGPRSFRVSALRLLVWSTVALEIGAVILLVAHTPDLASAVLRLTIVISGVTVALSLRRNNRPVWPLMAAALLLVASAAIWDQRREWNKYVESAGPADPQVSALLPEHAVVYWEDGIDVLWFKLRRSSYYHCLQSAGAMFFRDTATTYIRRAESLALLDTADFANPPKGLCLPSPATRPDPPTVKTLAIVCQREPELDIVVLHKPLLGGLAAGTWSPPVPYESRVWEDGRWTLRRTDTFFFYRCKDARPH